MTDARSGIVIIGTGLAGYSLAREFRKLDKETPLTLITRDDGHSYSKPMLSTGFTKNKSADALSMADPGKMAAQLGASIRSFTDVTSLDAEAKTITVDGEDLAFHKLVLATGAQVNRLSFPGSDSERVLSINDLEDYRVFRQALGEQQHVLIMGAGLIGCEYANDLIIGDHSVTIVDPSSTALNGLIPDFAGEAVVQGLSEAGADFRFGRFVSAIEESDSGQLKATLDDGQSIQADLVISAVGLKPDLSLAQNAGLECDRGIVVNRQLETSATDIYALGDCAQVDGHVLLYVLPLMACARALAKTLNGEPTEVSYGVMPVATKTPACPVVVCPPLSSDGNWEVEQDGLNIQARYLSATGEQLGFVLTGESVSEKQALAKTTVPIHQN